MKKIRTGVIGVGSMGKNHARLCSQISDLVGVSDLDLRQGENIANKYETKFFKDYNDLLEVVEAVIIAVPTIHHLEVVEAAAKAGVNVLVEKPLASNIEDCHKILSVCKENKVKLAAGHIERFNPCVMAAKENIDNGEWGKPVVVSTKRVSWYPDRISDVGVILDIGIHDLDLIPYLCNSDIASVYAVGGSRILEKFEDYAGVVLELKNGTIGFCEFNWLTPRKIRSLTITTTSYFVSMDYISQKARYSKSVLNSSDNKLKIIEDEIELNGVEPLKLELESFLDLLSGKSSNIASGYEGKKAVEVALACMESIEKGKKIVIS